MSTSSPSNRSASFGIQISGQFPEGMPDPVFFRDLAQAAESLRFESVWSGDHISFHHPIHEIVVASSFLAAWTERMTIGLGVMLLALRPPVLAAKQVASLDVLADGRLVLGVGVGGEGSGDYRAVGVPLHERGTRTDEGIDVLRSLWSSGAGSYDGDHYRVRDVTITPEPTQPGGPPIWIGGRSERALVRVGQRGDGWLAYLVSPERFARGRESVSRWALAAGRSPSDITFGVMLPTLVDLDGDTSARRIARQHLSSRYRTQFSEHALDRYCLVGDPATCRQRLSTYLAAGATHVVLAPVGPCASRIEQLKLLRSEVLT